MDALSSFCLLEVLAPLIIAVGVTTFIGYCLIRWRGTQKHAPEESLGQSLLVFIGWIAGILAIAIMIIVAPFRDPDYLLKYQTYNQYLLTHLPIWGLALLVGSPGAVVGSFIGGLIGGRRLKDSRQLGQVIGAAIGGAVGGLPFGFLCFAFFYI